MQPTPEIASAIADRYTTPEKDLALRIVMRRLGLAALTPEALREYALTLGGQRRFDNRMKAFNRARRVEQATAQRAAANAEAVR